MSQERREQLIEQYMSGRMSHAEEQQFFIEVAVDDELRRTLRAYRIIDSAIRKEREASTQGHQDVRERVTAAFLAAGTMPLSEVSSASAERARTESIRRPLRWITAGILAVGLVILAGIELPLHYGTETTTQPATTPSTRLAPDVPREMSRKDVPQVRSMPEATTVDRTDPAQTESSSRDAGASVTSHRNTTQHLPQQASAADTVAAEHNRTASLQHASIDSVPRSVTTNDTLRLPVRINWKIR